MSEPRTRTAAEVADHAGDLQGELAVLARTLLQSILAEAHSTATPTEALVRQVRHLTWMTERLAAQVEDLAAEVDRLQADGQEA